MPLLHLLRHAESEANAKGVLAGRDNSVNLTSKGRRDSRRLISTLASIQFESIYSSPITRCLQTINPYLENQSKIEVRVTDSLIEMDYGSWSGKKLSTLNRKKEWELIQSQPSDFTFPNGESFQEMRKRVKNFLNSLKSSKGPILLVSHGDVIKMALAITLDLPLNKFQSFMVSPASLSSIIYSESNRSILSTNQRIADKGFISKASRFILGGESA